MVRRGGAPRIPLRVAALVAAGIVVTAGCRQALSTLVDLPPPTERPAVAPRAAAGPASPVAPAPPRPAIERLTDPDSVRALLPRDRAGNIDWVEAVRRGIIRPRPALPGRPAVDTTIFRFAFDFYLPGPDTTFDAYFPHSVHTGWVDCQQCHARIFPYRGTKIAMADVFQGRYCGECHGKVAFPVTTGCERCHQRLPMPPDRAQPEFLGTVRLARVVDSTGNAAGVRIDSLPRSVFPHWRHRIQYQCKACHLEVFEPRNGANEVTMQMIADGQACGVCHNGVSAFRAGFGTCERCHVPERRGP